MVKIKTKLGTTLAMDASDNPTFEEWMQRIDKLLWRYVGLSVYDLPDCTFRKWYDKRLRPVFAANLALRRANNE